MNHIEEEGVDVRSVTVYKTNENFISLFKQKQIVSYRISINLGLVKNRRYDDNRRRLDTGSLLSKPL